MINEHKKGFKAKAYPKKSKAVVEPPKPRNPVAKNASAAIGGGGAGSHKSPKDIIPRKAKHKKNPADSVAEARANTASARAGLEKRKTKEPLSPEEQKAKDAAKFEKWKAKNQKPAKVSENFDAEYDDEAGMSHNSLHTIMRAANGLTQTIEQGDNLPEWCQEKISLAEDYLVTVWDYILSEKGSEDVAEGSSTLNKPSAAPADYAIWYYEDPKDVVQTFKNVTLDVVRDYMRDHRLDPVVYRIRKLKPSVAEAGSPAQQAAIAINMKKHGKKPKKTNENYELKLTALLEGAITELNASTKASYKDKAEKQVKELEPWTKKGEYKDLAKRAIDRRQKGLARVK